MSVEGDLGAGTVGQGYPGRQGGAKQRASEWVTLCLLSRCSGPAARPPAMPSGGPGCSLSCREAAWAELPSQTGPVPQGSRCGHAAIQHKLQSFILMEKGGSPSPWGGGVLLRSIVSSLAHAWFG